MFFEHTSHSGCDCRDGGLKANNPIQQAVNESKSIWGKEIDFDLLLSIGPGHADKPQKQPSSRHVMPQWLTNLLKTLLSTMDGQGAWDMFVQSAEPRIHDRATRLNVEFEDQSEPALDDIGSVRRMELAASTTSSITTLSLRIPDLRRFWVRPQTTCSSASPSDSVRACSSSKWSTWRTRQG